MSLFNIHGFRGSECHGWSWKIRKLVPSWSHGESILHFRVQSQTSCRISVRKMGKRAKNVIEEKQGLPHHILSKAPAHSNG